MNLSACTSRTETPGIVAVLSWWKGLCGRGRGGVVARSNFSNCSTAEVRAARALGGTYCRKAWHLNSNTRASSIDRSHAENEVMNTFASSQQFSFCSLLTRVS